jgi:sorbose reductase
MIKQGTGGNIVCISSVAGHKAMSPQTCSAYIASKWAVRGLVKQIAGELAVHRIRCNSISPGTVHTDMLEAVMQQSPSHRKLFEESNMLKRLAKPDELNAAMLYLMSNASSYVTGNDLLVDGGILGLMT